MIARARDGAQRSLFRRLMLGFMGVMLLIWVGVVAWTLHELKADQARFAQMQLQTAARQVLVALRPLQGQPERMRAVAIELEQLQRELHGGMSVLLSPYQIQLWQGRQLVHASSRLPLAEPSSTDFDRLSRLPVDGPGWYGWVAADSDSGVVVRVAQETLFGFAMGWTSLGFYLLPLLVSFPFLLLPAWFVVRRGLRPLLAVGDEIEQRSAADLSPLAPSAYRELSPLIASVNRLMARLTERLAREQEFLQDAAHELKTPLAIIQAHAEALLGVQTPQRRQQAGEGLVQGLVRATHTVHQLMALARSGADHGSVVLHDTDLAQLVRERIGLAAPLALQRGVEIELDAPETWPMPLHRESAAALADNLIDNAVKFSPAGGRVAVALRCVDGAVQLSVRDTGPGIPPALRAKVFERFYRLPGQDQAGSGLGLAIAARAAACNHARIRLADGPGGRGLHVLVDFGASP